MDRRPRPSTERRTRLIRLIHVAKGQLQLDEETYRALLLQVGGVRSTTAMDVAQLETVLHRLKRNGFKVKVPKAKGEQRTLAHHDQDRKIRALWLDLHARGIVRSPDESALAAYVQRMTKVEALQWLTTKQASRVIESLKKWLLRCEDTDV